MKKFISILLALIFVFTLISTNVVNATSSLAFYKAGDTNFDKCVNINDVTKVQKYLAGIIAVDNGILAGGDVNGDGKTDINDVTELQRNLVSRSYVYVSYPYDNFNSYNISSDLITVSTDNEIKSERVYGEDHINSTAFSMRSYAHSIISLINTKEEFSSFVGTGYVPEFDDEFFKENSLLIAYINGSDDPQMDIYKSYSLDNITVNGNILTVTLGRFTQEGYSPITNGDFEISIPEWYIIYKVSKSDVSGVENIVCSRNFIVE
jgi:hypothetical protein